MKKYLLVLIPFVNISCNSGNSGVNQTFTSAHNNQSTQQQPIERKQNSASAPIQKSYSEPYLRQLIASHFHTDIANINGATSIISDLHGDSIDVIELALEIERSLHITIPDNTIANIKTVSDFYTMAQANK